MTSPLSAPPPVVLLMEGDHLRRDYIVGSLAGLTVHVVSTWPAMQDFLRTETAFDLAIIGSDPVFEGEAEIITNLRAAGYEGQIIVVCDVPKRQTVIERDPRGKTTGCSFANVGRELVGQTSPPPPPLA